MFVYVVGYGTCEESQYDYLVHEKGFFKEEFEAMIHECALKAIKEMKKAGDYLHSYQGIHDQVVEYLKEDFGFTDLKTIQEWTVFGWASMFKHGDWSSYRDEPDRLTALVDKVLEAGYSEEDDSYLSWQKE